MPYLGCKSCHHEWESGTGDYARKKCDWCGGDSYILEEKTPLEKMDTKAILKVLEDLNKKDGKKS